MEQCSKVCPYTRSAATELQHIATRCNTLQRSYEMAIGLTFWEFLPVTRPSTQSTAWDCWKFSKVGSIQSMMYKIAYTAVFLRISTNDPPCHSKYYLLCMCIYIYIYICLHIYGYIYIATGAKHKSAHYQITKFTARNPKFTTKFPYSNWL